MVEIHVKSLINYAATNEHGDVIFTNLVKALKKEHLVTVNFEGITNTTTSFVNSAFIPLLEFFTFEDIKKKLKIVKSNRQINESIKNGLEFESKRITVAA